MKNLRSLIERGSSGPLASVVPTNSAAAWNSFATGVNPGRHGVYDFVKREPGSYRYLPVTSRDRRAKAVWEYATDAGLACCMVNVPLTYPPEPLEGLMISGFPYPEKRRDYVYPDGLLTKLEEELGPLGLLKPSPHFKRPDTQRELLSELSRTNQRQAELVVRLLGRTDSSLFVTVFDATDVAGHFFWKYTDPLHPAYIESEAREFGGFLYDAYDSVDASIGRILSALSPEDDVFVVSDHGFGPSRFAFNVNGWLLSKGYLRLKRTPATRARKTLHSAGFTTEALFRTARRLGMAGPRTHGDSATSRRMGIANAMTLSLQDVDWKRTRAYSQNKGGQVFVNTKGREPLGIVAAGDEAEALKRELSDSIGQVRAPGMETPVFDSVVIGSTLFAGPFASQAPDIFFSDSKNGYGSYTLFDFGDRELFTHHTTTSGGHRRDGIIIAAGPHIKRGSLEGARLLDMAPTLLYMMGLSIPEGLDGRVLEVAAASGVADPVRSSRLALAGESRRWARSFGRNL